MSSAPLNLNVNEEHQHVYSSSGSNFHAYMDANGDAHARLSLDTYKYVGQDDELAMSLVYFGACGDYNAEVQLKRTTALSGGNGDGSNDFDSIDRLTGTNLDGSTANGKAAGLGNVRCYAQPSAVLTGDSMGDSGNTDAAYDALFLGLTTNPATNTNLYPDRTNMVSGDPWEANTCAIEGGGGGPAICTETTGDIGSADVFGDGVNDQLFRYSADTTLDSLRRQCNAVTHEGSDKTLSKTTFKVAHEIIRPSQRAGDYVDSNLPSSAKIFRQTCQQHAFTVQVNKALNAISGGEYSQEIEFKVLSADMIPCAAVTPGGISGTNCDTETNGCGAANPPNAVGGEFHKLQMKLLIEFPVESTGDYKYVGIQDSRIQTDTVSGGITGYDLNDDGTYTFNDYNFAKTMNDDAGVGVVLSAGTLRAGYTSQVLTIDTDCIDASLVGSATECNADVFRQVGSVGSNDYGLNFRFRACQDVQCLAGGDKIGNTQITYEASAGNSPEQTTSGECADQCIDVRSDLSVTETQRRGLAYPQGSKFFPLKITMQHSECPVAYNDDAVDSTISFGTASIELFESAFHPLVPTGDRISMGYQRQSGTIAISNGELSGREGVMEDTAHNSAGAVQINKFGQGETVVAALVADKTSARTAYTVWIQTARLCKFASKETADSAATSGSGCTVTQALPATNVYSLMANGEPVEEIGGIDYFGVQACKQAKRAQLPALWQALDDAGTARSGSEYTLGSGGIFASDANMCPDFMNDVGTSNKEFTTNPSETPLPCEEVPASQCGRGRAGARFTCDWDLNTGTKTGDKTSWGAGAAWDALSFRTDYMVPDHTSTDPTVSDAGVSYWLLHLEGFAADCSSVPLGTHPQSTHYLRNPLRSITAHTFGVSDDAGAEASMGLQVEARAGTPTAGPTRGPLTGAQHDEHHEMDVGYGFLGALIGAVVTVVLYFVYKHWKKRREYSTFQDSGQRYHTANPAATNLAAPRFKVPSFKRTTRSMSMRR